jgi:uncharacterized protein (DUF1800 family)
MLPALTGWQFVFLTRPVGIECNLPHLHWVFLGRIMVKQSTLAAMRFGYGLPLPKGAPTTPEAILAQLRGPDTAAQAWPILGLTPYADVLAEMKTQKLMATDKKDPVFVAKRDALIDQILQAVQDASLATFGRATYSPDGFRERLANFWANHFSVTGQSKLQSILPFSLVEDAIRPNLSGYFVDMLTAVSLHPAMLIYLDQSSSIGPNSRLGAKQAKGLNENLAREVMELHSLGVEAGYSQADVTELARLLTGVTVGAAGTMKFDEKRAEPGEKTVMGMTYNGTGLDVVRAALRDLALHPVTAQHLARKLVVHFVSDQPDADLVEQVAAAYLASGGNLTMTYQALLNHPAAWQPQAEKARQPFDFIVASLRALQVAEADLRAFDYKMLKRNLLGTLDQMGQPMKRPSGPNGFPEEAGEWITPQGLAHRITWAMQMPQRLVDPLPDPVQFAQNCLDDRASEGLLWAAARAEDIAQGVGLVLASAEFNRR